MTFPLQHHELEIRLEDARWERRPLEGVEILDRRGLAWCMEEDLDRGELIAEWAVDLRYAGQAFEITLSIDGV